MRAAATSSIRALCVALLAACAAPPIDASLETDGVNLPERSPPADDAGSTTTAGDSPATAPSALTLTVTLSGSGGGAITSNPSGLTCMGATCTGSFPRGTAVMLAAAPAPGSVFVAWSGPCTGTGSCAATLDSDVSVGAQLEALDGAWAGTYTNTRVASGCTFKNAGNLTATVKATGTTFSSAETITGLELRSIPSCNLVGSTTGTAPSADLTVAGNTFTGTWTFAVQGAGGTLAFPFTAKVTGKTMTGTWTCATCTGSFTLTKP
jgi:hypothetical protein